MYIYIYYKYLILSSILNSITVAQISNVEMNYITFPFQLHMKMPGWRWQQGYQGYRRNQKETAWTSDVGLEETFGRRSKWCKSDPENLMDDTVNTGLSNNLVPLPESVLIKICDDILSRWAAELTLTGVAKRFCGIVWWWFLIASFSWQCFVNCV